MAVSNSTLKLLRCRRDSERIAKVLKVIGQRASLAVEGEMVILIVQNPLKGLASKKKSPARKASRKKAASR